MRLTGNMKMAALFLVIAVALAACGPVGDLPAEETGSSTTSPTDLTPDSVAGVPEAPNEETGSGSDPDQANSSDEKATVEDGTFDDTTTVDDGSAGETDDAEVSQSDLPLPTLEHPKYPDPEIEIPPPRD